MRTRQLFSELLLHPKKDEKGNIVKDKDGKEIKVLKKIPIDPKKGVDFHGEIYKLNNRLYVKTSHLCKYKRNYNFFNEIALTTLLLFQWQR